MQPEEGLCHQFAEITGTLGQGGGISIAYRRRAGKPGMPGVVFLGGFRSDMTGCKASAVDRLCAERGQAYCRFDYRGHGASGGRFEEASIGDWLADSGSVLEGLTEGPQILVGSSMGGWLAVLLAEMVPARVAGLVLIAPAIDFTEDLVWNRLSLTERQEMERSGGLDRPSEYGDGPYVFTHHLIVEARAHLVFGREIGFAGPVRVLQGMRDDAVPWQVAVRLTEALPGPDLQLTLVKDGDHRLSRTQDLALIEASVLGLSGTAS